MNNKKNIETARLQLQLMILADNSVEIQLLYNFSPDYKEAREKLRAELQRIINQNKKNE